MEYMFPIGDRENQLIHGITKSVLIEKHGSKSFDIDIPGVTVIKKSMTDGKLKGVEHNAIYFDEMKQDDQCKI